MSLRRKSTLVRSLAMTNLSEVAADCMQRSANNKRRRCTISTTKVCDRSDYYDFDSVYSFIPKRRSLSFDQVFAHLSTTDEEEAFPKIAWEFDD